MYPVLQTLNLLATCTIAILLWRLGDRLDPFRVHARPPPLKALSFFSRFFRKRAFKPIPHKKMDGPDVPLLHEQKLSGPWVNYYVPKGEPDAEPFMASHTPPDDPSLTTFERTFRDRFKGSAQPDTYEVEGHVIPGEEFRDVYEIAKVAVRLPRQNVAPTLPRPPVQKRVLVGTPKLEMTEEEARALAEEYELFDEPRMETNGVPK